MARRRRKWTDGEAELRITPGPGTDPGPGPGKEPDPATPPVRLEIAASYRARTRGLLGRTGIEGAMLLTPATSVHTFRMRFPIDVAHLDRDLRVLAVRTMPPNRLGLPRLRSRHVLEAEAGSFAAWNLRPGTVLTLAPAPSRPAGPGPRTAR